MHQLFFRELKAHFSAWLIWSFAMAAFVTMMFSEFSAYYQNPEMAAILDAMPKALIDAFGMGGTNLTTLSGFVAVAFIYLLLIQSIYAVMLGSNIIAKEERDKTTEFLMVLPLSRRDILLGKSLAAMVLNTLLIGVLALSLFINALPYSRDPNYNAFVLKMFFILWLIASTFMCMGMACAGLLKSHKRSTLISVGIVITMYLLSIVSALSKTLDFLKHFTFFKYFESVDLLANAGLKSLPLLTLLTVTLFSLYLLFNGYPKRDLNI